MADGYRTNGSTTHERNGGAPVSEHDGDPDPDSDVETPADALDDDDDGQPTGRTSSADELDAGRGEQAPRAAMSDEPVVTGITEGSAEEIGPRTAGGPDELGDPGDRFRDAAKRAIEAMVMVAEEPMAPHLLAQLLEISPVVVDALCRELAESYEADDRGFQLVRVAGGWRYQSHPDQAPYVERLVLEGQAAKLSAAALETLAIVAYKQPISRAQVAAIRGVSVDGVMRTLQQRGFIVEVGRDPGPGQAVMFGTSASFLVKLGLNNLDELPPLGDFVPTAAVVEQLERGLRPDREPLRPEDAFGPAPEANGADGGDHPDEALDEDV